LPILRELLRTRSVARTAERVGLSQSAVSTALAKLRSIYGDQLLVMVGRSFRLTSKAESLIEQTEQVCRQMEALLGPAKFDPAIEDRRFVICAADYVSYLIAPKLTKILRQEAPLVSVHFVDYHHSLAEDMMTGAIDILATADTSAGRFNFEVERMHLFTDDIVVIGSTDNPDIETPLTIKSYGQSDHALFSLAGLEDVSHEERLLRKAGIVQKSIVLVEDFLTLPAIVEDTHCLALVQYRLAKRFEISHRIKIYKAPFETPPLHINAYWSKSLGINPAHTWFREKLLEAAAGLNHN
tara:strand:+ start:5845 stop:6735 length:891 start_codon:yes stop_codon:yes gene_type:complete